MWRILVSEFLSDLKSQRKRALLTTFAVTWGTLSVVLLLSFGEGLRRTFIDGQLGAGDRIFKIYGGTTSETHEGLPKGRRIRLREADLELLDRSIPEITLTSPSYGRGSTTLERGDVRTTTYMEHPVFHDHQSETEMMRYLHELAGRDLSLTTSMIPLGSCTMKLNPAATLMPITMSAFNRLHPFVPRDQAQGYDVIVQELSSWLAEITGFHAVSLQPNSGASGEYAGLLVIRAYHQHRDEAHRTVCLVPESAHGTNPASAVMAGMKVVTVKSTEGGDIDLDDLRAKAEKHADNLAALMITYPSTHGVFEREIREICDVVHEHGGQVYMDGANMNAQVGLARPGEYGPDVCHLNLHKTFAIPHGGGGPGMGPIGVAEHLVPFLPGPVVRREGDRFTLHEDPQSIGRVREFMGNAPQVLKAYAWARAMGAEGLREAADISVLANNYMDKRLAEVRGVSRSNADVHAPRMEMTRHSLEQVTKDTGCTVVDISMRMTDYGIDALWLSHEPWLVAEPFTPEAGELWSKEDIDYWIDVLERVVEEAYADPETVKSAPHNAPIHQLKGEALEDPARLVLDL